MKFLIVLSILALTACAPSPTELPEDFNPDFAF